MKKTILKFILSATMLAFTMGCSENEMENITEKDFSYKFDIASIKPLTGDLDVYKNKTNSLLKSGDGFEPDYANSHVVTYTNTDVSAIFIPLIKNLKSGENSTLMLFELNNELIDFDLIISETLLSDEVVRYAYSNASNEVIQFDVQLTDGLIINVITTKSWGRRWTNCVEWTIGQMNGIDVLACMAFGKWCAGGIAALCAVGASEGYFAD